MWPHDRPTGAWKMLCDRKAVVGDAVEAISMSFSLKQGTVAAGSGRCRAVSLTNASRHRSSEV